MVDDRSGEMVEGRTKGDGKGFRLIQIMKTDPARYKRFLDNLRLGCTVTASAEGIGVSSSAAHRAIQKGAEPDSGRALKKLRRDVYQAISAARILSEAEVRVADPKFWLARGPGRMLGHEWDVEQGNESDGSGSSTAISSSDIIKGLIELRRSGISIDELIDDGRIHTLAASDNGGSDVHNMRSNNSPHSLSGAVVDGEVRVEGASNAAILPPLIGQHDGTGNVGAAFISDHHNSITTAQIESAAISPPLQVHNTRPPLGDKVCAGVNGESSNPIPPTLPKPKTRRVPVYTLKDGTPLGDYDPPNITKVEPLPKNVKDNIKLTSPKDIGVDGYKNVVEIVQNGNGCSEDSPSIDRTIEGSHDLVAQSCNMENNTGQSTEDLLKNLELANQRRSERKMIEQMEKEELEELEDSLPDGLRRFLLNEGN